VATAILPERGVVVVAPTPVVLWPIRSGTISGRLARKSEDGDALRPADTAMNVTLVINVLATILLGAAAVSSTAWPIASVFVAYVAGIGTAIASRYEVRVEREHDTTED